MNYVKTNLIDTIYAGNKSNQVTRRNAYSDVGQALKSNRESANQMNKDQEMNFIELSSLGGLRSRELEYDNRDAMKQIMRVLANAIGEQRASEFSIYALIDTAFMKNSPIPELDFSQGEDVSKQILEHTTNGFYVTKAESGVSISKRRYIFIHDQTHPGLVYKVNVSDSGRGDYETIFSTYLIPKEVIQDYVQETTQNDKERKFNREIGRFGREQSGVLELNGQKYDNITVNDESITIQNPDRSLLINGQQFPEGIHQVVKIPAILAPDQESVIALLKMGDTVLSLDMNREDISQQFLVVLDRIAPQYSQEVQGQLDKLTIFNRITKQRLEERKRFAGALDIMTQKKEQANNKADALEADLGKEKIELSSEKAEKASVQKELALKSKVLAEVQLDRELLAQITPQTIERYLEHGTPLSPQEYLQREIKPFSILPGETILGRSKDANIVLSDQSVSRVHATFSSINGRVQIVDNGSSNGTYVDGERLTSNSPVEIVDGSVIKFGKSFSEYVFFNQKLILRTKYQNLPKFIF